MVHPETLDARNLYVDLFASLKQASVLGSVSCVCFVLVFNLELVASMPLCVCVFLPFQKPTEEWEREGENCRHSNANKRTATVSEQLKQ